MYIRCDMARFVGWRFSSGRARGERECNGAFAKFGRARLLSRRITAGIAEVNGNGPWQIKISGC